MARNMFGGSSDDYAVDTNGRPLPNRRIRFYTSAAMTSEITDLASDVTGTGSPLTVSTDSHGFWGPVYGPDGVTTMYAGAADGAGNPPGYVVAIYTHTAGGVASFNSRTGPVTLSKADVTGTALAAADVGAENVVVHGSTAGTARPAGATVVHWIGSVAPTNVTGNDEWTDTANKIMKRWNGSSFDSLGSTASGATYADRSRWATSTVYAVGDLTSYRGDRYICGTAHTAGATFDATKFIRVSALLEWWHVDDFGAKGDGQAVWDAAMTAASATLTSATGLFVAGDVGKPITVHGAGATAGGVHCPLVTTISAYVSATQVTLAATAGNTTSAATAVWGTDDTAAIQAAINAACVQSRYAGANTGKLVFRAAVYCLAAAHDVTHVGQLFFPTFSPSVGGAGAIELCGTGPTGGGTYYVGSTIPGTVTPPMAGTILWGMQTAIGNGSSPALLSTNATGGGFNLLNLRLRNLTFRTFGAVGMDHLKLSSAECVEIYNVNLDVSTAEAMDVSAFGSMCSLRMPSNTNGAWSIIDGLVIYGGHAGILASEHTHIKTASVFKCYAGVVSDAADHSWTFDRLQIQSCVYHIAAAGASASIPGTAGASKMHGHSYDTEHAGAGPWYATVDDIFDPLNNITGKISCASVVNGTWTVNSATGVAKTLI